MSRQMLLLWGWESLGAGKMSVSKKMQGEIKRAQRDPSPHIGFDHFWVNIYKKHSVFKQ
jgi:hypothetical protein